MGRARASRHRPRRPRRLRPPLLQQRPSGHRAFSIEQQGIESQELAELAAAAGTADVPSAVGDEEQIVARLDAASVAREGREIELFVDHSKLHLFDLETGRNITVASASPPRLSV
jgi:hypothetical protein